MNPNKISEFIIKNRKLKGLSQKQLADMVGVSHQSISRWELGSVIPDNDSIEKLCKVFNVSKEELLFGESKKVLKEEPKKYNKFILFIPLFLILAICLFLFFIINATRCYKIDGKINTLSISDGIILLKNNEIYFSLGNIKTSKNIKNLKLYYKNGEELIIYECINCDNLNITLYDNKQNNTYFDMNNIKLYLKNIYLKVDYEDESSDILHLNINKVLKHFDINEDEFKKDIIFKSIINNEELENKIINKFKKQNDGYLYITKKDSSEVTMNYLDNILNINIVNKDNYEYIIYNLNNSHLTYEKYIGSTLTDNVTFDTTIQCNDCTLQNSIIDKFLKIIDLID